MLPKAGDADGTPTERAMDSEHIYIKIERKRDESNTEIQIYRQRTNNETLIHLRRLSQ